MIDQHGKTPSFANFKLDKQSSNYTLSVNTLNMTYNLTSGSTNMLVQCTDPGGYLRNSKYFTVKVKCGPKSVNVIPRRTFKKEIKYKI